MSTVKNCKKKTRKVFLLDCFTFWLVWNRGESLSFLFAKVMERASLLPSPKCTSSRSHLTMWPNTRSSLNLSTWYKPSLKADILQRRRTGWDGVPCTLIAAGGEVKWFGRFGIRWPADFVRSHLGLPTNEQSWKHWWEQKKSYQSANHLPWNQGVTGNGFIQYSEQSKCKEVDLSCFAKKFQRNYQFIVWWNFQSLVWLIALPWFLTRSQPEAIMSRSL